MASRVRPGAKIVCPPVKGATPHGALEGSGCGHCQLECLQRMPAAGDHVGHAPSTRRGEQRVAGGFGGEQGPVRGGPGEERLAHPAEQRGRGVVDQSADLAAAGSAEPVTRAVVSTSRIRPGRMRPAAMFSSRPSLERKMTSAGTPCASCEPMVLGPLPCEAPPVVLTVMPVEIWNCEISAR